MTIRDATPEEAARYWPTSDGTLVVVADDGEKIVGHLCLSRNAENVFGHSAVNESDDKTVPLRLWRYAQARCKEWGFSEVWMHAEVGTPQRIVDFWLARGAVPVYTAFKLTL